MACGAVHARTMELQTANPALSTTLADNRRVNDALRESEERYRSLFDAAQDGIALAEVETGNLVECNQALCHLVERNKDELVGQHQSILHPPQDLVNGQSPTFRQHLKDASGQIGMDRLLSKSGKLIPVEIRGTHLSLNGRDHLLGIFRDISERKRAEEQMTKQIEELRRWHEVTLGRETGVLELKREVNALLTRLGEKPKYGQTDGDVEDGEAEGQGTVSSHQ